MTPAQLDHLSHIKRHLETLLANAEKRTPGEWKEGYSIIGDGVSVTVCNAPLPLETLGKNWITNRAFIASCAGNAEAGWRSTLTAISLMLNMSKRQHDIETAKAGFDAIESIIAAWPLELITNQ